MQPSTSAFPSRTLCPSHSDCPLFASLPHSWPAPRIKAMDKKAPPHRAVLSRVSSAHLLHSPPPLSLSVPHSCIPTVHPFLLSFFFRTHHGRVLCRAHPAAPGLRLFRLPRQPPPSLISQGHQQPGPMARQPQPAGRNLSRRRLGLGPFAHRWYPFTLLYRLGRDRDCRHAD